MADKVILCGICKAFLQVDGQPGNVRCNCCDSRMTYEGGGMEAEPFFDMMASKGLSERDVREFNDKLKKKFGR